jgi:hypothetical protein
MSYLGRAVLKLYMEVHYLKRKKREKLPHGSDIAPQGKITKPRALQGLAKGTHYSCSPAFACA